MMKPAPAGTPPLLEQYVRERVGDGKLHTPRGADVLILVTKACYAMIGVKRAVVTGAYLPAVWPLTRNLLTGPGPESSSELEAIPNEIIYGTPADRKAYFASRCDQMQADGAEIMAISIYNPGGAGTCSGALSVSMQTVAGNPSVGPQCAWVTQSYLRVGPLVTDFYWVGDPVLDTSEDAASPVGLMFAQPASERSM